MRWRRKLASASGAILGFVGGNLPGAALGYKGAQGLYDLTNKMKTPTPSGKRRGSLSTPYMVIKKRRRGSVSSVGSSRRSSVTYASGKSVYGSKPYGGLPPPSSVSNTHAFKSQVKGKLRQKKRVPGISRKFKRKVQGALQTLKPSGHHRELFMDAIDCATTDNGQDVWSFPTNATNLPGYLFTAQQIVNSCSRLYGIKAKNNVPLITDADSLSPTSLVVDVISQYAHYTFRNNSVRTITLIMYVAEPKQYGIINPLAAWSDAITQSVTDGYSVTTQTTASIYDSPMLYPQFNELFKCTKQVFVMEPGQSCSTNVYGECGVYDLKKCYKAAVFQNVNKKGRYVFFSATSDLVFTSTGTQHAKATATSANNFLLMECEIETKFVLPEQAGFTYPTATTIGINQALNKRIRKYAFDNYAITSAGGSSITRVDDDNPALETA